MPASESTQRAYHRVVAAITQTPWAIEPTAFAALQEVIRLRLQGATLSEEEIAERIAGGPGSPAGLPAYTVLEAATGDDGGQLGGIAVLPLYGVLAPRMNMMTAISGGTSLEQFGAALDAAAADQTVGRIVLDVNSPGGSVSLLPETAAKVRAASQRKPVTAVANTMAASAAYWLASQADELVVSPSGSVGSIGVLASHEDESGYWEQKGIETTLIHAGKYKVEGNPFGPLSDEARADMQSLVDDFYGQFVDAVAKGRGVSTKTVRSGFGEGRMVWGRNAVSEGMADKAESLEATLARLTRPASRRRAAAADSEISTPAADVVEPAIEAAGEEPVEPPTRAGDEQDLEGLDLELDHLALRRRS